MKYIDINTLYELIDIALPKVCFKSFDIDKVLDDRDLPAFENNWLRSFKELSKLKLTEDQNNTINLLREKSFKKILSLTEDSDLAAYVSDDFEIMAKYLFSDRKEMWISKFLINSYMDGKFPH